MAVLDEGLAVFCDRLEIALQAAEGRPEPWVVLANLVEPDGSPQAGLDDRIVVSLVSLQAVPGGSATFAQPSDASRWQPSVPPLHIDVYVVVVANFAGPDYRSGLAMIARAMSLFHETPVFTRADTPELPDGTERLAVEFVSLDFSAAHDLLPARVRAMPFALYRLRGLALMEARHPIRERAT